MPLVNVCEKCGVCLNLCQWIELKSALLEHSVWSLVMKLDLIPIDFIFLDTSDRGVIDWFERGWAIVKHVFFLLFKFVFVYPFAFSSYNGRQSSLFTVSISSTCTNWCPQTSNTLNFVNWIRVLFSAFSKWWPFMAWKDCKFSKRQENSIYSIQRVENFLTLNCFARFMFFLCESV